MLMETYGDRAALIRCSREMNHEVEVLTTTIDGIGFRVDRRACR
jgi:hypothetical protein